MRERERERERERSNPLYERERESERVSISVNERGDIYTCKQGEVGDAVHPQILLMPSCR